MQAALLGAALVRLRREATGGGVPPMLRSTKRCPGHQRLLEEFRARRRSRKAKLPRGRRVGDAQPSHACRKGKERAEFGDLLDRGVEEGRQEDRRDRGLQRAEGGHGCRRHALEVLPLRLE